MVKLRHHKIEVNFGRFRYLLARIFKNVLFVLFLVCFFSVLLDFVHKSLGYLEKYNPSIQALTTFYIFWLPMIVQQLLPLAFTFGATFVVIGFSRSNELSAMFALGMTYRSLLLPFFDGWVFACWCRLLFDGVYRTLQPN